MEERFLLYAIILPGLVAFGSGDKILLLYHVTSRDHVLKGCVTLPLVYFVL